MSTCLRCPSRSLITLMVLAFVAHGRSLLAESPESIDFFEKRIRPVLVDHCYGCHSSQADEIGGSLLLDSRDGMMQGGDSGPAIDPGNVEASRLISAIRYESSEMPPDGKLPDEVVRDFEQWIAAGAVDPREGNAVKASISGIDMEQGRNFWAFRPLGAIAPEDRAPEDRSESLAEGDQHQGFQYRGFIDRLLGQRLQDAGITPNEMADASTQLRRLSVDLTGLPPSLDMQSRWLGDPTSRTWSRLVDELLASPAFGEHWARHWMDVARYADSNGSDFNATFHEAWRYRDYLIRSFQADRPFDQMIRQQIAGDLLPFDSDEQRYDNVVATTFLMLGTKMLSERDKPKLVMDVVDEQIDTVGRAFLGLTLGCARCHDHKFDPIPAEDYYALAGIFKSTVTLKGESQKYVSTWNRIPLPTSDQRRQEVEEHEKAVKALDAKIKKAEKRLKDLQSSPAPAHEGIVVDDQQAEKSGNWRPSVFYKHFIGEGYIHDDNSGKGEASIRYTTRLPQTGTYEIRISHSPGSSRAAAVPITIRTVDGEVTVTADQRSVQAEPMWSSLGKFQLSSDADTVVTIANHGTSGYVIADAVQFLPEVATATTTVTTEQAAPDQVKESQQALESMKSQLAELKTSAPEPLPVAMAPSDQSTDQIGDVAVHIRGEVNNLGSVVPRGFLRVCTPGDSTIQSPRDSGRTALADWLTDPDNGLVARVLVNRVWMHLIGEGLVRTVDNFGVQGERPTHPELLDALAIEFIRGGWQLKPLIRQIVNSDAYRRSSRYDSNSAAADPENRLLWRIPRRRLPAESIRDAMLAASGQLDDRPRTDPMKGRGVLVSANDGNASANFEDIAVPCRSIYLPIVRGYLPAMMTSLDVADPDLLVGQRPVTNVPSQALVMINSPEVNQWALVTANRILREETEFDSRLRLTCRLLLQREPNAGDLEVAKWYFRDRESSLDAWHHYVSAMFAGTPFRLLD